MHPNYTSEATLNKGGSKMLGKKEEYARFLDQSTKYPRSCATNSMLGVPECIFSFWDVLRRMNAISTYSRTKIVNCTALRPKCFKYEPRLKIFKT